MRSSRVRYPSRSVRSTQVDAPRSSAWPATTRATPAVTGTGTPLPRTSPAASWVGPSSKKVSAVITSPSSRCTPPLAASPSPQTASWSRSSSAMPRVLPASSSRVRLRTRARQVPASVRTSSVGPVTVRVARAGFSWWTQVRMPVCSRTSFLTSSSWSVRTPATAVVTRRVNLSGVGPSHGPTVPVPSSTGAGSPSRTMASTLRASFGVRSEVCSAMVRARARSIRPASIAPRVAGSLVHRALASTTSCSAQ